MEKTWSDNDVVDMIESRPTLDVAPVKGPLIKPKTVTWSGVDLEDLKKTCEKVSTVNVKSGINGEWVAMPVDEFFRMLGDRMMIGGKRWPEH